jgi:hypothetical protein
VSDGLLLVVTYRPDLSPRFQFIAASVPCKKVDFKMTKKTLFSLGKHGFSDAKTAASRFCLVPDKSRRRVAKIPALRACEVGLCRVCSVP